MKCAITMMSNIEIATSVVFGFSKQSSGSDSSRCDFNLFSCSRPIKSKFMIRKCDEWVRPETLNTPNDVKYRHCYNHKIGYKTAIAEIASYCNQDNSALCNLIVMIVDKTGSLAVVVPVGHRAIAVNELRST
jgi:hypothetical protein